jgi:glycosyltransferase involved in cell wall biosynthesis
MPRLTAIIHTHNDALRIGRAIESLRPCDEILIVDHQSSDRTVAVAQQFGGRVISSSDNVLEQARHDWILALLPNESSAEALEAALFEWKSTTPSAQQSFSLRVLEETAGGWQELPPETRLVHRQGGGWSGPLPRPQPDSITLDGYLLRLAHP